MLNVLVMPQIHKQIPVLNALTSATGFGLPFIGNPALNDRGLHLLRIKCADIALNARHRAKRPANRIAKQISQDGVAVIEDFVPTEYFHLLQDEIRNTIEASQRQHPVTGSDTERFGSKQFFKGGFDRYDGQTLNRFLDIEETSTPQSAKFLQLAELREACESITGTHFNSQKFQIYLTRQQAVENSQDPQLQLHRDTFFSCIKLWYFTEDVNLEDGPFRYSPGSHLMTQKRLDWERDRSKKAARTNAGGSFRISNEELKELELQPVRTYEVRANTLVMADVRGFHARGPALRSGAQRLSIYGNIRPWPFAPIPYRC